MSASQAALTFSEGAGLLSYAYSKGVDIWDTAELYGTYGHIREALKNISGTPVISTKSYAWDRSGAKKSFDKARRETGLERIGVFMLHEQPGILTILGAAEALRFYIEMRDKGLIGAVGISTHAIEPVLAIALSRGAVDPAQTSDELREFDPGTLREGSVIHPIINKNGIGLLDGTAVQMESALRAVRGAGVGVLGMKLFGGGNLLNDFEEALRYGLGLDFVDSFAVGMQSIAEIDLNVRLFSGGKLTAEQAAAIRNKKRKLHIESWCTGCGRCVSRCRSDAITIVEGKAKADPKKCVLCSYCAAVCPEFAIKVV